MLRRGPSSGCLPEPLAWSSTGRAPPSLAYSTPSSTGLGGVARGHFADRVPIRRGSWRCSRPVQSLSCASRLTAARITLPRPAGPGRHRRLCAVEQPGRGALAGRNPGWLSACCPPLRPRPGALPFFARHSCSPGLAPDYVRSACCTVVMGAAVMLIRDRRATRRAGAAAAHGPRPGGAVVAAGLLCFAALFCCVCMARPSFMWAALGADLAWAGARFRRGCCL